MINITKKMEEVEYIDSVTCDVCKTKFTDDFDIQEMQHLDFIGGYKSIFGDGVHFRMSICQDCLKKLVGDYIYYELEDGTYRRLKDVQGS